MSQKGVFVLERRELQRTLEGLLHAVKRDDVKVSISFLVQLSVDEENYVHTVIDPWQPLSRARARSLVEQVIEKLDEQEKPPAESSSVIAAVPGIDAPGEGVSDPEGASPQGIEMVPETAGIQSTGE